MGVDRKWRSVDEDGSVQRHKRRQRAFREQEDRLTDLQPGGRLQPGSGCGSRPSRKADSRGDYFLVSGKSTARPGAKSIRVERGWLEEIEQQAAALQPPLRPALTFGFDREDGQARLDYTAFRQRDAERLIAIAAAVKAGDYAQAALLAEML